MKRMRRAGFLSMGIMSGILLAGMDSPVVAQEIITGLPVTRPELQVKFLGAADEELFFEVSLHQPEEGRSHFRIRNENGQELFSQVLFRKQTTQKVKIAKGEAEKLEFLYSNLRHEVKKSFGVRIRLQEAIEVRDISQR